MAKSKIKVKDKNVVKMEVCETTTVTDINKPKGIVKSDETKNDTKNDVKMDDSVPEGVKKMSKKNLRKYNNRAQKAKTIKSPTTILENVMKGSICKEANLSQKIQERFYQNGSLIKELQDELSDIIYEPTVGETTDGMSDVAISVLPTGFEGQVNLGIAAITILPCINAPIGKRWTKFRKGRKNKEKKQNQVDTNNSKQQAGQRSRKEADKQSVKASDD